MNAPLKPYPNYRPSGVKSFDRLPTHWEVRRLRNVADLRVSSVDKHKREDEEHVRICNYVDVYNNDRITATMNFMHATATPDEIEQYRLKHDDVLITKDSETWDDIGVPALVTDPAPDLISGYHLALLRPRSERAIGGYLFRALESKGISRQFHVRARGVTRFGLTHVGIKSVWLPVPSLSEQAGIVRFLDRIDRRIRRHIRARQEVASLLEEQKQALIHQAVTGQIDVRTGQPYPAYKRSGVEWLEKFPAHWQLVALRRRWRVIDCKHLTVPFVDEGIPLASVREAQSFELDLMKSNRTTPEWYDKLIEGEREPRRGDLIYCRNVSVGAAALVTTQDRFAMGQDVCLIRSSSENQRWLNYFLHSKVMSDQLALVLVGSTFNRINVADIKGLVIGVPPVSEQDRIAAFLDDELSKINAAIRICHREQALLREFRNRLIEDVVTGKLDVREAAVGLPEDEYQDGAEESADEDAVDQEVTV